MSRNDADQSLLFFRRQYLQLFEPDFLAWPPRNLLRTIDAQAWIYKHLFDENRNTRLPPTSYQERVLRILVSKIHGPVENAHEVRKLSHYDGLQKHTHINT